MIRNPNEIQEGAKKIRMLIAGYPGIGKSTPVSYTHLRAHET